MLAANCLLDEIYSTSKSKIQVHGNKYGANIDANLSYPTIKLDTILGIAHVNTR